MSKLKRVLAGKVLLILLAAAGLTYIDSITELKLGLDLKGGTQLDYQLDLSAVDEADQAQIIEGVQEVIRRRVDSLGVSEPSIYVSNIADEYHVIVELAGISDIEEARETVGKTIQLEFKEENPETDDAEQRAWAEEQAQIFYGELVAGGDFETLANAATEEFGYEEVSFVQQEGMEVNNLNESVKSAIAGQSVGSIVSPFELNQGYTVTSLGGVMEFIGMGVIQVTDRQSETVENTTDAEVSARHLLVAYEGAERSEATRSQEEALAEAEALLARIQAGESLADLAGEHSDDLGSGADGGDLGSFGLGVMTQAFEDAAFSLEVGGLSEIVETEFGYHIIEVYEKQAAETTTEVVETVSYNQINFSISPDPWAEEPALTGEHFKHADVAFDQSYNPYVTITFTDEGGDLFQELTRTNINKQIAIFVGGQLISAPNVQQEIGGGQAQITGSFSLEEAQALARDLNTGAIPAPIELVGQYTISATLGAEALDQSLYAGIVGLILLAIYMLAYYRIPGLIADVALAIYSVLIIFFIKVSIPTIPALLLAIALFSYLIYIILKSRDSGGEKMVSFLLACVILFFMTFVLSSAITLTLAGVAGVILSIGMAVDANVLIFERMKEELRAGKELPKAIEDGFHRAWDSIRDSNFSSLITCGILFYFGSSIIRGFALNLALGILISMFSAIMLTRTFLNFAASTKLAENEWLFGKPKAKERKGLPIIKNSKIWAALSGSLLTVAIVSIAVFGLNLGIDFTGGTLMEVQGPQIEENTEESQESVETQALSNEELAEIVLQVESEQGAEFGSPQIVSTDQGTNLIRLKHISEDEHEALLTALKAHFGEIEELRFTTVGPTIGSVLKKKALIALAVTLVMIVFYIAFAFRRIPKEVSPWRFGFCAIAALVHDILLVVGLFVILGVTMDVEIDALFITALLTIMGFSVHDTIVVFDRVRENLKYRKSDEGLAETANRALNQTMARSINTSISTLITILALLFLGADSIQMFVLALAVGILFGTYSSIFVASPLLVWWNEREQKTN